MSGALRIAMLAPISHPVPPRGYGPWERVASDLVEGLVRLGHDVTLYASAGSQTTARLVVTAPDLTAPVPGNGRPSHDGSASADDLYDPGPDQRVWEEIHLSAMAADARAGAFDIVHSHLHVHALPLSTFLGCPMIGTLHGSAWNRAHHPALLSFPDVPWVSLSEAERTFLPSLRYVATVPNGVRVSDFPMGEGRSGACLFVGRLAPEKAPDLAIAAARRAGVPIVLVGPVEPRHQGYFDERIRPAVDSGHAEYLGPLEREDLSRAYQDATALVMPLRWEEPFGLVVVEAMVSGTPVIAWRRGAMPEIVDEAVTGHLVDDVEDAVRALSTIDRIDRTACRSRAIDRFGSQTMAAGYVDAYRSALEGDRSSSTQIARLAGEAG